ncbi:unnamed protein product [Symbiodinium sp. CCMP2592]|nr:unnamed protein product [Symbiodinium sp. CCMP2592]
MTPGQVWHLVVFVLRVLLNRPKADKKKFRRAKSAFHFFMASVDFADRASTVSERNKYAAGLWKGLNPAEKRPFLEQHEAAKKALAQAGADAVDDELLDASEWEERTSQLVIFQTPPGSGIKPERQLAAVWAPADGNPLLAQHCGPCARIYFPVVTLMSCPRCRKSLQKVQWDSESQVFRVEASTMLLPGTLADLPKDNSEAEERYGNEVIVPKHVSKEVKKWTDRGFQFSTAALTLLCKSAEEFASLQFVRGEQAATHRKKKTLTLADMRFGSRISDAACMGKLLRARQKEAQLPDVPESQLTVPALSIQFSRRHHDAWCCKVLELRVRLFKLGKSFTGSKLELIQRLLEPPEDTHGI